MPLPRLRFSCFVARPGFVFGLLELELKTNYLPCMLLMALVSHILQFSIAIASHHPHKSIILPICQLLITFRLIGEPRNLEPMNQLNLLTQPKLVKQKRDKENKWFISLISGVMLQCSCSLSQNHQIGRAHV